MKKSTVLGVIVAVCAGPAFARSLQVEVVDNRPFMVAFAIGNDAQSTVAGDNQIDGVTTAVAWVPGASATLMSGAAGISQAGDVASNGDVVGWMESQSGASTAVIWHADSGYTTYQELGMPAARVTATQGYKMNDAGDVAVISFMPGYSRPGEGEFGVGNDYWRWAPSRGYAFLPHLSGQRASFTSDINSTGTIVGYSTDLAGNEVAVTWSKTDKLAVLGKPSGASSSRATSINNAGTIVGTQNGGRDGWVWTKKNGFKVLGDFGFNAEALQINNSGIIVGTADVYPYEPAPVVWDADGNLYNIAEIAGYDRFSFFEGTAAINDKNQIVVYGYNMMTGDRDAVVLQLKFID